MTKRCFTDNIDCSPLEQEEIQAAFQILKSKSLFRYNDKQSESCLLEKEVSTFIGTQFSLAVNSCSSGLLLSLLALGVTEGDAVLCPGFTFVAVPSAIHIAGASPVLIDCDSNYSIDFEDFKQKAEASKARYFLLSYMRGIIPKDLYALLEYCNAHDIQVIEDCAHALGVLIDGKAAGTFGKVSVYSTQSHKIVNSGEGGLIVTNDDYVYEKMVLLSGAYENHCNGHLDPTMSKEIKQAIPHYNFRMTNLTSAIIRTQLPKINQRREHYKKNYERLIRYLIQSPSIQLPELLDHVDYVHDSIQFSLKEFSHQEALAFSRYIDDAGIPAKVLGIDTDNARCYRNWTFISSLPTLPHIDSILNTLVDLRLPLYLEESHIDEIGKGLLMSVNVAKSTKDHVLS